MSDEPAYYGILPANVRYDKRLKPMEKIMFTEITSLSNKKGYCYSKNKYFADLYEVSPETVSRWISNLVKYGYVNRIIKYMDGTKAVENRFLTINPVPIDKIVNTPIDKNNRPPIDQNVKNNNTRNSNIIKINIGCVFCVWSKYPSKKGKAQSMKKIPKLLKEFKIGVIIRAIDRYIEDVEYQRSKGFKSLAFKNGSTFFNSGIYDYVSDDYELVKDVNDEVCPNVGEPKSKATDTKKWRYYEEDDNSDESNLGIMDKIKKGGRDA